MPIIKASINPPTIKIISHLKNAFAKSNEAPTKLIISVQLVKNVEMIIVVITFWELFGCILILVVNLELVECWG
jgi:hypothetical protein